MDMNKLRNSISNMRCRTHNKTPQNIRITGAKLQYEACCDKFRTEVAEKLKTEVASQAKDDINKAIKKVGLGKK